MRLPCAAMSACLLAVVATCPPGSAWSQEAVPPGVWSGKGVTVGPEPFKRPTEKPRDPPIAVVAPKQGVAGIPWPRLDPGAVLCRSADDLQRRMAVEAAVAQGQPAPAGPPPSCQIVHSMVAVAIVSRQGPAQTEVRLSGGGTGWTSAYLPAR